MFFCHQKMMILHNCHKSLTYNFPFLFKEFFENINGKVKGLKGYAILENIENDREIIVLTFWEGREDMENYYSKDSKILSDLVEKVKPIFEKIPERSDYKIALFELD